MDRSVVVTGIGVVNAAVVGASPALAAWLAQPRAVAPSGTRPAVRLPEGTLAGLVDPDEARRLSRVCQLTIAAARLAVAESGVDPARGLGLVVGSELGDFTSTIAFADGYLTRGPAGLSPLLFPSTVMNTMAATTAIAAGARGLALTINVPTVAGELAVARGAAAVASGRAAAVLAGGVDELDPLVDEMLGALGDGELRGEGATFLVLEAEAPARARGAPILGRIAGAAWRAMPAGPWGVGRRTTSRAIADAVARAGGESPEWLYVSASGDARRDAWESAVLEAALGPRRGPAVSLAALVGHHAGLGALHVAAAGWTSRSGLLPAADGGAPARVAGGGLVHGLARGGGHVAIVVRHAEADAVEPSGIAVAAVELSGVRARGARSRSATATARRAEADAAAVSARSRSATATPGRAERWGGVGGHLGAPHVVIIIPVFEEAATVGGVVTGARAHGPVLVVDDGSGDESSAAAARAGAQVLRHPRRLGKAQALLTGIAAARRRGASLVVTLDGDGQHDPAAIPAMLAAARRAGRAVIVGNRLGGPGTVPGPRRNAIRIASFFTSWSSGLAVEDSQSGFRVYPVALFDEVRTRRGGFVFETEILLAAAEHGWGVEQVGVAAIPRAGERSRFRPLRDGVAIGGFLAARAAGRWAREIRALGAEVLAVFEADRLATRHAAILEEASPYGDSAARWSAALGTAVARRAGQRLGAIWRDARARGTTAAATATLAAPVALPLLLLQTVADGWLPDVLTPLVEALYAPAAGDGGRMRADVATGVLAERR